MDWTLNGYQRFSTFCYQLQEHGAREDDLILLAFSVSWERRIRCDLEGSTFLDRRAKDS